MKKLLLSAAAFAVVAVSAVTVAPTTSEAVPGYARQTGAACLSCHFQVIPRLSAFGRNFKMGGMRDMGEGALLEDDHLSLPLAFNASFMFKARIRKNSSTDILTGADNSSWGGKASWQWPDESAIFVGGRYGEHLGGLAEIDTNVGGGVAQYKVAYVFDTDNGPVAIAWGETGGHGAAFIMNDPSNTVIRNTRGWFERSLAVDLSSISGNKYGAGVYAVLNDMFYVGAGYFGTGYGNGTPASTSTMGPHARIALITELAGFDTVVGGWYGRTVASGALPIAPGAAGAAAIAAAKAVKGTSFGLDVQMQGELGDLLVGFYMPVVLKGKQPGTPVGTERDVTGYYPTIIVSMGHMGARFGYDYHKDETKVGGVVTISDKVSTPVFGAWYSLAQNFELIVEYSDAKTKNLAGATAHSKLWTFLWEYVY